MSHRFYKDKPSGAIIEVRIDGDIAEQPKADPNWTPISEKEGEAQIEALQRKRLTEATKDFEDMAAKRLAENRAMLVDMYRSVTVKAKKLVKMLPTKEAVLVLLDLPEDFDIAKAPEVPTDDDLERVFPNHGLRASVEVKPKVKPPSKNKSIPKS